MDNTLAKPCVTLRASHAPLQRSLQLDCGQCIPNRWDGEKSGMDTSTKEDLDNNIIPVLSISYAVWTIYVQMVTTAQFSFAVLMRWSPLVVMVALVATVTFLRGRTLVDDAGEPADKPAPIGRDIVKGPEVLGRTFMVPLLAVVWVALLFSGVPYVVFWCGCVVALAAKWISSRDERDRRKRARITVAEKFAVAALAVIATCVTLFASRPDLDDAFYMSIPATILRFPQEPILLHDTMYRTGNLPLLMPVYRLDTYEILIGAVSRLTGVPHMQVAYLMFPPVFAVLAILVWAQLMRLLAPERWLPGLAALLFCVLALGEAHHAYGNFAFVRLFQGKAILATIMVPAIVYMALTFSRYPTVRNWLALLAAQTAAVGFTSSGLFVAPVAAGMALASQWKPDLGSSKRLLAGVMASVYVFAAAGIMLLATHGGQGFVSHAPALPVFDLIKHTWGPWSAALLLFGMLTTWHFCGEGVGRRYFLGGSLFFLLCVLNPYASRFLADHVTGLSTYWRLTWALPLPFFLAIMLGGLVRRTFGAGMKRRAMAVCIMLVSSAIAFAWQCGTLRSANFVELGMPGPKVFRTEYPVARQIAESVPEDGMVLAPELVAGWLSTFTVHPGLLGVRGIYLANAFGSEEAVQRLALMEYVAGQKRSPDSPILFQAALDRYHLTCIVVLHSASWQPEISAFLITNRGWKQTVSGAYDVWERRTDVRQTAVGT